MKNCSAEAVLIAPPSDAGQCDELYRALEDKVKDLWVIGDAFAPRLAYDAIVQALDVGVVV